MGIESEGNMTYKSCLMFEEGSSLCTMCGFPVDPDEFVCGDYLDKLEFGEEKP